MKVKVGLGTSIASSPARWRMSARAKVVLPAPRSPDSVTRSPVSSALAMSIAKRTIAGSFGNVTVKLAPLLVVRSIGRLRLGRRQRGGLSERERACHGGALPDNRGD